MTLSIRITQDEMYDFIPTDSEMIEILTDLANGDYTIEAYREDIQEWRDVVEQADLEADSDFEWGVDL